MDSTTLTANEIVMLVSVFNCHYGEDGGNIWSWAHNDSAKPHNLPKTTAAGVIGSLVKKGLMHASDFGRDSTCGLTAEGKRIAAELDAKAAG